MKYVLSIFLLFNILNTSSAQFGELGSSKIETVDSTEQEKEIVDNMFFDIFYGKPGRAALYGLVLPSGGQVYNKRWWKVPLVLGLEGYLGYRIWYSTVNYNGFQKAYLESLNGVVNPEGFRGVTKTSVLKSNRDKFRKQREFAWVYFIGGHLLSLFEAFIDRHLMEFDVSDDLSFHFVPSPVGVIPSVGVRMYLSTPQKKKPISTIVP